MANAPLSLDDFRTLASRNMARPVPVARFVGDDGKVAEGGALEGVTMSTETPDHGRDTVDSAGWETRDFDSNPVLQWCHDYSLPPVGQVQGHVVESRRLVARRIVFTPEEVNPFGAMVGRLYTHALRFMRGFSVGFLPEQWRFNEERGGVDFLKQKLLELSACPIPMNPEALSGAKSAGIDMRPLAEFAAKTLDGAPDARPWMPLAYAGAVYRSVAPTQVQVPAGFDMAALVKAVRAEMKADMDAMEERLRAASQHAASAPTKKTTPSLDTKALASAVAAAVASQSAALPDSATE